ncbi:sulfatase family protein [Rhodohalobacter sulfatireducens]|uniref:Sulfatase-like hydrolase/transferase n=1 Tax=Rhodohalobacter sulfatireducens TaxID=2911366 RepID=A0ABS9KJJ1_9BACT|nr:sulfatase-like hydrolase/transferase [Rhodohalobacter sulfatireducens]MCG2591025.1 sulfatase-like hydrolase/transferase [Rhodohalobacter sulfatireducens]
MKSFRICIGVLLLSLGLVWVDANAAQSQDQPNVLIILTDDQGYHDVSYYGTGDLQTPNIDQLAEEGMRFDNFYANSSVCAPTRAALLSGQYQDFVGVPGVIRTHPENNWGYLDPDAVMLPSVMQEHGYHTALVGKWHVGLESPNIPNDRGFDHFHGWLGDMMDDYWEHRRHGINYMRLNWQTIDPEGHATDLFTDWSVEYLNERANEEEPFLLYLAYNAPHFPVQPPKEWLEKVKEREPEIHDTRANLVAFIEHMDAGIGEVIQALKDNGQYENTFIIFTSDNGGHRPSMANNGPLRGAKQSMYEGGLKVPTVVTWPAKINPGTSTQRVALTMDIFPTLFEAAGIPYDGPLNGKSFLPTLLGEEQPPREEPLYFSRREGGIRYGGLTIQAVQLGDWKLLQNSPFSPQELYNLANDPTEEHNRIHDNPEKYKELNNIMQEFLQKGGQVPWQRPDE